MNNTDIATRAPAIVSDSPTLSTVPPLHTWSTIPSPSSLTFSESFFCPIDSDRNPSLSSGNTEIRTSGGSALENQKTILQTLQKAGVIALRGTVLTIGVIAAVAIILGASAALGIGGAVLGSLAGPGVGSAIGGIAGVLVGAGIGIALGKKAFNYIAKQAPTLPEGPVKQAPGITGRSTPELAEPFHNTKAYAKGTLLGLASIVLTVCSPALFLGVVGYRLVTPNKSEHTYNPIRDSSKDVTKLLKNVASATLMSFGRSSQVTAIYSHNSPTTQRPKTFWQMLTTKSDDTGRHVVNLPSVAIKHTLTDGGFSISTPSPIDNTNLPIDSNDSEDSLDNSSLSETSTDRDSDLWNEVSFSDSESEGSQRESDASEFDNSGFGSNTGTYEERERPSITSHDDH